MLRSFDGAHSIDEIRCGSTRLEVDVKVFTCLKIIINDFTPVLTISMFVFADLGRVVTSGGSDILEDRQPGAVAQCYLFTDLLLVIDIQVVLENILLRHGYGGEDRSVGVRGNNAGLEDPIAQMMSKRQFVIGIDKIRQVVIETARCRRDVQVNPAMSLSLLAEVTVIVLLKVVAE